MRDSSLPEIPATLIEALYDDVTAKAKSIAFSTVFGPSIENGIKHTETLVEERGGSAAEARELIERIRAAKDPDEFARSA